jgi:ethanolamine ammonia-lyase small subunit
MDNWHKLRALTKARIAQGSAGSAQRTEPLLDFQIAHAEARDAVWKEWDCHAFGKTLRKQQIDTLEIHSGATHRRLYLQRPDLGRNLDPDARKSLEPLSLTKPDIALIVSNGLSTPAIERHATGVLVALMEAFSRCGLTASPVIAIPNGRVALSDEIGVIVKARASVILIGERPGLSTADSLGIYITLNPSPGNTDAERNCISNIHEPDGLHYAKAADKTSYLLLKGLRLGIGGVELKDDSPDDHEALRQTLKLMHNGTSAR